MYYRCVCVCMQRPDVHFGVIVYCSSPRRVNWLQWLALGLQTCYSSSPADMGSQFTVLSIAASILWACQLHRVKEECSARKNVAAPLHFGLQLGAASPLPHSLVTMVFCPSKKDWTFWNQEPKHTFPSVVAIRSQGTGRGNKHSAVQFKASRISTRVHVLCYAMVR